MSENQIRIDIKAQMSRLFNISRGARFVEELEICSGRSRADIAVFSDRLIGIEIKGPKDNLTRLSKQVDQYSRCFDQVVLVVHELHVVNAVQIIPPWWGVVVGGKKNGVNIYKIRRNGRQNRNVDMDAVLSLLWREEIENLFVNFLGFNPPVRVPKKRLRAQLLKEMRPNELKSAGIQLLRQRKKWRSLPVM